jgi:hypothetical protein
VNNNNPTDGRFANTVQRLLALFVFVVCGYLIWLAYTGRYDTEVNRFANWLRGHYHALVR